MEQDTLSDNLITVQTVYELASEIGEHVKKLIDQHGQESNQDLIPPVVRVLEYLEEAVLQREGYLLLVDKLHRQIEDLQRGQVERTQQQKKYLSEFEDIDESWRKENIQLSQYVKFLRSENRRLTSSLSDNFSQSLTDLIHDDDEKEKQKLGNLANAERLKTRINLLCKDIESKKDEIDNLKTQNDTLIEENTNLRNIIVATANRNNCTRTDNETLDSDGNVNTETLQDKKLLEEKIKALEDEIEMYKMRLMMSQVKVIPSSDDDMPLNDKNNNIEQAVDATEENVKMEDLPVQGPIPKEPDEKLYFFRDRKSRIWSFFPRLTRALIK